MAQVRAGKSAGAKRGRAAGTPMVVEGIVTASTTSAARPIAPADGADELDDDLDEGGPRAGGVPDIVVPLRHRNDGWTPIWQRAFLRALAELGSVTDACKRVGMSTASARRLRAKSAEFAAAWDKAASIIAPILEQAAYERGVEGWDEPVFHGGQQVGVRRRYSDACLGMLYRPKAQAVAESELATMTQAQLVEAARAACERAGGFFCEKLKPIEEVEALLTRRIEAIVRARKTAGDADMESG